MKAKRLGSLSTTAVNLRVSRHKGCSSSISDHSQLREASTAELLCITVSSHQDYMHIRNADKREIRSRHLSKNRDAGVTSQMFRIYSVTNRLTRMNAMFGVTYSGRECQRSMNLV